ncbi:MAG: nucleotidyltransferase domain-containing protein [Deltaproteobacteria bacterium]|nr:nucleotidyltransferase domain-containing protein [Deltaproteobacteria bacterium]
MTEDIVNRLKKALAERSEIRFAYLFGSHAKGAAGALSDVDVAVFVDGRAQEKDYAYGYRAALAADLMAALGTNGVDVVVLNEAGPFLRLQVIRDGVVINNRDELARQCFWVETLRLYDDAKWLMAVQQGYMARRIETGRFGK